MSRAGWTNDTRLLTGKSMVLSHQISLSVSHLVSSFCVSIFISLLLFVSLSLSSLHLSWCLCSDVASEGKLHISEKEEGRWLTLIYNHSHNIYSALTVGSTQMKWKLSLWGIFQIKLLQRKKEKKKDTHVDEFTNIYNHIPWGVQDCNTIHWLG